MTSTIPPACTGAKCVPKISHAKKTLATGSIVAVIAVSAGLSQRIGEDSIRAKAELERQRSAAEARFALLEKRAERTRFFGTGRMLNAFPELKPNWHAELLQELRERLGGKKH